ncbi:MAG: TolC family protein [Pseudomonadota bacterium]
MNKNKSYSAANDVEHDSWRWAVMKKNGKGLYWLLLIFVGSLAMAGEAPPDADEPDSDAYVSEFEEIADTVVTSVDDATAGEVVVEVLSDDGEGVVAETIEEAVVEAVGALEETVLEVAEDAEAMDPKLQDASAAITTDVAEDLVVAAEEPVKRKRRFLILPRRQPREDPEFDVVEQQLGDAAGQFVATDTTVAVSLQELGLSLSDYLRLVAVRNDRIAYQKMEWAIARSGLESATGMREAALVASYTYTNSETPNTTEEEFRRSFAATFDEKNNDYSIGVEKMMASGARVNVSYNLRSLDNNIQPAPIRGEENKGYLGISVTQPVMRGGGGRSVVEAPLVVAEKEESIALQTFRQAMMQEIANAASVYWDAFLAEKKLGLRQRSVEIAETVVEDERERGRFGRSAETAVLDVESALAQRRVQYLSARQELRAARNEMHRLIASQPDAGLLPEVLDEELTEAVVPDRETLLASAFEHRPEYQAGLLRAEAENVKVRFAKNNRLPQLDLVASYGLNSLASSVGNSIEGLWNDTQDTLVVGVEFRMPLGGNRQASGELSAAQLRQRQALLEIKAAEISIHNSVDTARNNMLSAISQVEELDMVRETNERLLVVEMARFEAGQSNSRELLDIEERLNRAMELDLESKVNLQKARVGLGLSDGTLLRMYALER